MWGSLRPKNEGPLSYRVRLCDDVRQVVAWHVRLGGVKGARVTLTGDVSGDYVVEAHYADGRLVLRPDLSVKAILARHGSAS